MRKYLSIAIMALSLIILTGCADFKAYMKDRGNDLADCFTARVGISYGLGVRAQVTNYTGAAVGFSIDSDKKEENKIGYFGRTPIRECSGGWAGAPIGQFAAPASIFLAATQGNGGPSNLPDSKLFYFIGPLFLTEFRNYDNLPSACCILGINVADIFALFDPYFEKNMGRMEPPTPFLREKFFVEVGVEFFAIGFDFGFNPVEFVDFLLGWTTLDITGDDFMSNPVRPEKPKEESGPDR